MADCKPRLETDANRAELRRAVEGLRSNKTALRTVTDSLRDRTGGNLPGLTALQGILFAMGRNLAHLEESLAVAEESPSADVSSNVHESWTAERARGMLDLWLVPGADPSKAAAEVAEKFTEGDISLTFAYLLTAATDPESQPARQLTLLAVAMVLGEIEERLTFSNIL